MTALWIVLAVLLILAFLPLGIRAEYSQQAVTAEVIIGPVVCQLYPAKPEKSARRKAKPKKPAAPKDKAGAGTAKKGGDLPGLLQLLELLRDALGIFSRRFHIWQLTIQYTAAGSEPDKTAMAYGAACAAGSALEALLRRMFRVHRLELRASCDFCAEKSTVYGKAAATIALWALVYLAVRTGLRFLIAKQQRKRELEQNTMTTGKAVMTNGEAPDR